MAESLPASRRQRMAALDGLRGVAILVVVVHHVRSVYAGSLDNSLVPGAFLGVDLFFVLSGFLITGLLLKEHQKRGSVRLGAFYRRRLLRLYPALVALLLAHMVYASYAKISTSIEKPTVQSIFLYYFNWRRTILIPEGLGHLWSLSVEEQFYLLWPLLLLGLLFLTSARRRYAVPVLTAAVVFIGVYRAWRWNDGMFPLWIYERTDTRADSLLVGALLAVGFSGLQPSADFFRRNRWVPIAAWTAVVVLAGCVLTARLDKPFLYLGGFTVVAVASALLIVAVLPGSTWNGARALETRPLVLLGIVSYGLYLWHLPIFVGVQRYGQSFPPVFRVGLALALTACVTAASWYLIEQPFLRWKDRLEDRRPSVEEARAGAAAH